MRIAIHELVHSILQKDSLQDCNLQELQQLVNKYPYSSALQLLLTQKLRTGDKDLFETQAQRSSLYFPDRLWFDYLLEQKGEAVFEKKEPTTTKVFEPAFTPEKTVSISDHVYIESGTIQGEKKIPVQETAGVTESNTPAFEPGVVEKTDHERDIAEQTDEPPASNPAPEPVNSPTEMKTDSNLSEGQATNGELQPEPLPPLAPLKIEPIDPATAELSFEPFHTVDYFASQGIKFSEEEKPKDKFGQQLKSFTEWLKTIKKTPATEIATQSLAAPEEKVEKLAAHSLADREVITEAMAQVWEKQGKPEKAIAIYGKLSLLNPSKSSYFAAKIEHLKQS